MSVEIVTKKRKTKYSSNKHTLFEKLCELGNIDFNNNNMPLMEQELIKIWQPTRRVHSLESKKCLCKHNPIFELCYIYNVNMGNEVYVGNECIKTFYHIHVFSEVANSFEYKGYMLILEETCCSCLHFKLPAKSSVLMKYREDFEKLYGAYPTDHQLRLQFKKSPKEFTKLKVGKRYRVKVDIENKPNATGNTCSFTLTSVFDEIPLRRAFEDYVVNKKDSGRIYIKADAWDSTTFYIYGNMSQKYEEIATLFAPAHFDYKIYQWVCYKPVHVSFETIRDELNYKFRR